MESRSQPGWTSGCPRSLPGGSVAKKNPSASAGDLGLTPVSGVTAKRSRNQTHSEGQRGWWRAVYCTSGSEAESPLSQGPQPTFVKTLYTLSVELKPTSPNSLNLAWKVLKGDTIRLQPWFIIRRVSWLYIVAYTNGCHKDYRGDWLQGDYYILFGNGKSWYRIWCLSFWEASSAIGMLSPWLPGA